VARIRSIKPEIRISETVNSWPIEVRYFWIMLWGYVDDFGKGRDNAKLIVADTYPLDDSVTAEHVSDWLDILAAARVIQRYTVAGKSYLAVTNWSEHQRPSHPAKSVIPDPPQDSADSSDLSEAQPQLSLAIPESSSNPPEDFPRTSANGSPEQGAGSREQGADEQVRKTPAAHVIPANFSLTPDRKQWATENAPAVNADRETQGFIDYWAGEQAKKKNWESTWRNWMRRKQTEAEAKGWKSQADLTSPVPAMYGWANR
jgi:hypothetical protein